MALLKKNTKQERFKKLTLLHSNDMHGDFLAENLDEKLVGGVSMLSGYITKVRNVEKNVLYAIAGDMFRGSVIDSEYKGLSTVQIVNLLAPDVVTLGNHETDYGISHLLFLEKCATFPIINCNLFIKQNGARLFEPCRVVDVDGMKILFIGILTEEVINQTKAESLIGSFIDINEAAGEVGKICNAYNAIDIDFTVLLTHIGFEEDKKLAKLLDPSWGVDVIIGGHSHTFLTEPEVVNGIPIVQAGTGTDQIGRFDITIDTEKNCIKDYTWEAIPINESHCPRDKRMETLVQSLKGETDLKYGRVVTKFNRELGHPKRNMQTDLGSVFADAMKESLGVDIFLMGSGSIRSYKLGPVVTYQDFVECYPYAGKVHMITVTGAQFKKMLLRVYRDDAFVDGDHTEFYQLSTGMYVVYQKSTHSFVECKYNGEEMKDDYLYTVGIQHFHFLNLEDFFGITLKEVEENKNEQVISTNDQDNIEAYFHDHDNLGEEIEERLVVL